MDYVQGQTLHSRHGDIRNSFEYGVDFVVYDFQNQTTPAVFSHNKFNLWSLYDKNHGGVRGDGDGIEWFRQLLVERGFPIEKAQLLLLTQPSFLWFHFNPVSFWVAMIDGLPHAFVAEVNSTFGQRHYYFCAHPDFRAIAPSDVIEAEKLMHVSPFQRIEGTYQFRFEFTDQRVNIRINYKNGNQGVFATLVGDRRPASNPDLIRAALRRPFGAARVVTLIHWQALKLWIKKAPFLAKQAAPATLLSDSKSFQENER